MEDIKRKTMLAKRCQACGNILGDTRAVLENGDVVCQDCADLSEEKYQSFTTGSGNGSREITLYFPREHQHILNSIGKIAQSDFRTIQGQMMYVLKQYVERHKAE